MHRSVAWQILFRFQNGIVEQMLPDGTKRRELYEIVLKGRKILENDGWNSFLWKFTQYLWQKSPFFRKKINMDDIIVLPEDRRNFHEDLDVNVSVIIPTKNAGIYFDYVLNKIINQKGLKGLEVVVVDSGSTDDTLKIAQKYGAKIYQIRPNDFGHGKTSGFDANKTIGDFLILAAQDALPSSDFLINEMIKFSIKDSKTAAITCRQVPRSEADLMACFQVWSFYKFLDITDDKVISIGMINDVDPLRRKNVADLSDCFCCIGKNLFMQYGFHLDFAEDLKLGISLLELGYKLGVLYSPPIIYSHNRSAAYFFKVSYVNSKVVSQIVGDDSVCWDTTDILKILNNIKKMYFLLVDGISNLNIDERKNYKDIFFGLKVLLSSTQLNKEAIVCRGDATLDDLFSRMASIINHHELNYEDERIYNFLLNTYFEDLQSFTEYITVYPPSALVRKDFIDALYKIFANTSGAALGNFIFFLHKFNKMDDNSKNVDLFLIS